MTRQQTQLFSVSERLSKILFRKVACATFQRIETVCFFFTQVLRKVLASCTTSVYVNLSKNSLMPFGLDFFHDSESQVNLSFARYSRSFFFSFAQIFGRKRVQRYKKYQYLPNFKAKKFPKTRKFSGIITNSSLPYILYIMYVRAFTHVVQRF